MSPPDSLMMDIRHSTFSRLGVASPIGSTRGTPTMRASICTTWSGAMQEIGRTSLEKQPKESWTLCDVAYDGGLGGGWHWYLYFADVKMDKKA